MYKHKIISKVLWANCIKPMTALEHSDLTPAQTFNQNVIMKEKETKL